MRFYIYTTNKRRSETEAIFKDFNSIESAREFFNNICEGIEFCEKQFGHESSVTTTENHNGKNVTFVMDSRLKKIILSTQTTLERIFGNSKYAPLEAIAIEKELIEEATRREEAEARRVMEEVERAEREAERLGMNVLDYLDMTM